MFETFTGGKASHRRVFLQSTALAAGIATTANAVPESPVTNSSNLAVKQDRWSNPFKRMVVFGESPWRYGPEGHKRSRHHQQAETSYHAQ